MTSTKAPGRVSGDSFRGIRVRTRLLKLVAYDFGIKRNILRLLVEQGFDLTVVPATTPAADSLAIEPDGIFLSNGPGDPAAVEGVQSIVRELVAKKPVFGICLGHQILGLALGGSTHKLKFGHHGGNQPGKDLRREGRDLRREPRLRGRRRLAARRGRSRSRSRTST